MIKKKVEKSHPQKRFNIWVSSKWHIFWFLNFVFFVHNSLQKPFQYKMFGVFPKIQEIYSQMGTRISKIYWEMSEIMELKVGNLKNSFSRNWANSSHPWNLTFFWGCDFSTFFSLIWSKITKLKLCPYFTIERVQKLMKKQKDQKTPNFHPLTEDNLTKWPCMLTLHTSSYIYLAHLIHK